MADQNPCGICRNQAEYELVPPRVTWRCPRCGVFSYDSSERPPAIRSPDEMVRLSGWVREQNAAGVIPVHITPERSRRVALMRLPGLRDRALRVLAEFAKLYPNPDIDIPADSIERGMPILLGISYSRHVIDLRLLLEILVRDDLLRRGTAVYGITVKGILTCEELLASKSSAAQGFVAMWFDPSLNEAWTNGSDPGIRAAGFQPFRIDNKDYVGGISDEIMAEIRRSRFVVADYTGHRGGVYFEAGFALGLGLTVIPTCRDDEISELHFDIKHLNTLGWQTPAELADKLNKRIRAVVGVGPDAPDPELVVANICCNDVGRESSVESWRRRFIWQFGSPC
jgi:hypothetical protein